MRGIPQECRAEGNVGRVLGDDSVSVIERDGLTRSSSWGMVSTPSRELTSILRLRSEWSASEAESSWGLAWSGHREHTRSRIRAVIATADRDRRSTEGMTSWLRTWPQAAVMYRSPWPGSLCQLRAGLEESS